MCQFQGVVFAKEATLAKGATGRARRVTTGPDVDKFAPDTPLAMGLATTFPDSGIARPGLPDSFAQNLAKKDRTVAGAWDAVNARITLNAST